MGSVSGVDAERDALIASLLAADPDLVYSAETGKFYKHVLSTGTWSSALTGATSSTLAGVSGQLATIESAAENELLFNIASGLGVNPWIGASDSDVEGEWRWFELTAAGDQFWQGNETGFAIDSSYQNWSFGTNQPGDTNSDADYAVIRYLDGQWASRRPSQLMDAYLVEWDADAVLDVTQALTYTIQSQTVAGAFEINSDNGKLTVADGSLLDYETNATHSVTVRVTDVGGNTYDETLAISLSDIVEGNNAPSDLSSGIELNTDGGNDAYLVAANGGAVFGGNTAFTIEVAFSSSQQPAIGGDSDFVTYAAGVAGSGNDLWTGIWRSDATTYQLGLGVNGSYVYASGYDASQLFDGQMHSVGISWDNGSGSYAFFVDGVMVASDNGFQAGNIIPTGGELVFGMEQDSVGGGFQSHQVFQGTLYDVRIWNEVRSEADVSLNYQSKFDSGSLPSGLVANWQMDGFNGSNEVVDVVSGNNLSIGHATGAGFIASTPVEDLHISENAANGTTVGFVVPSDSDVSNDVVSDGLFLEAPDPGSFHKYFAGETFGGWTVRTGDIDLVGSFFEASPLGGPSIDLHGGTNGGIYQTLNTEVGQQYQIVFALSGHFTGDVRNVRVSAGGESQDFAIAEPVGWSTSNMLWEHRSFTFTADSATTDLDFLSLDPSSNAGAVIADVQVIEVPQSITTILNNDATLSYDAATNKFYRHVDAPTDFNTALSNATTATLNGLADSC